MCPRLFEIGPFTVYSYGLMLAIGFIVGNYFFVSEFRRRKLDPNIANNITLIALISGIAGAKILYVLEYWKELTADPIGMIFNPGGLTFYGGFILAAISVYIYSRKKKIPFLTITDAISPALILAYGIARIGCHLSGDGDYGFPTTLPWGTNYSNGTVPPSVAFIDFPEVYNQFPGGVVPDNLPCHPTPVYEFLICSAMFLVLWSIRKKPLPTGMLFMFYLVLAGLERFTIEFIRINPRIAFGLSEAQLISIIMITIGSIGSVILYKSSKKGNNSTDNSSRFKQKEKPA
ncbi:MAG: prolipoprotein diacylglyceryl transferase [Bacteroidetes bacterium]|nr:prolipoprotein diacylglyceryl transferase [Bacteroidota bacterium]